MILMKIGPYSMAQKGISKYKSVSDLTLQKYDPSIDRERMSFYFRKNIENHFQGITRVITSNLKRAKETADYLVEAGFLEKDVLAYHEEYLNEIRFDIQSFCTESEYIAQASNIVRLRFLEHFINNTLAEPHVQIKKRFDRLVEEIEKGDERILFISHTFFIKLFLIYREYPDLFEKPEIVKEYINPGKRIMEFGEKFERPS